MTERPRSAPQAGAGRAGRAGRTGRRIRRNTSLCDALNRVLDTGAVVVGDLVVSVADVDLLYLNLKLLLSSVETILEGQELHSAMPLVESAAVGDRDQRPWRPIP